MLSQVLHILSTYSWSWQSSSSLATCLASSYAQKASVSRLTPSYHSTSSAAMFESIACCLAFALNVACSSSDKLSMSAICLASLLAAASAFSCSAYFLAASASAISLSLLASAAWAAFFSAAAIAACSFSNSCAAALALSSSSFF